jgi:CRISPR-associated exonuclease Cas4
MSQDETYLALSGIQHFAFCRRQWGLIHMEQQWEENVLTTEGMLMHARAHDEAEREHRGDTIVVRGLGIRSDALMLVGKCDVVEFHRCPNGFSLAGEDGTWRALPVEYKHGASKLLDADRLQVCAQALCLEEMLCCDIPFGYLYYGKSRSREKVVFDGELRGKVAEISREMHWLYARGRTPKVKKRACCRSCSLKDACLPQLEKRQSLEAYLDNSISGGGGK